MYGDFFFNLFVLLSEFNFNLFHRRAATRVHGQHVGRNFKNKYDLEKIKSPGIGKFRKFPIRRKFGGEFETKSVEADGARGARVPRGRPRVHKYCTCPTFW